MNQLSLLLYWGNVLGNLGPLFVVAGIMTGVICVILTIVHYNTLDYRARQIVDEITYYSNKDKDTKPDPKVLRKKLGFNRPALGICLAPLVLVFWVLAALCPSTETVYAIAASQMGEQALKTPLASKAGKALEAWLDKQIAPPPHLLKASDMKKYFVGYEIANAPTRVTIYYDRYSSAHALSDVFGWFDVNSQRDLAESLVQQLNLAMDRGAQYVRDQMQVALGLKLP
jgi:hypothetical protein